MTNYVWLMWLAVRWWTRNSSGHTVNGCGNVIHLHVTCVPGGLAVDLDGQVVVKWDGEWRGWTVRTGTRLCDFCAPIWSKWCHDIILQNPTRFGCMRSGCRLICRFISVRECCVIWRLSDGKWTTVSEENPSDDIGHSVILPILVLGTQFQRWLVKSTHALVGGIGFFVVICIVFAHFHSDLWLDEIGYYVGIVGDLKLAGCVFPLIKVYRRTSSKPY